MDAAPCLSNLTNSCQLLAPPVCPRSIALLEVPMDSVRLSQLVSCLPSGGLSDGPMYCTMPQILVVCNAYIVIA
jgi:hypothetical protein